MATFLLEAVFLSLSGVMAPGPLTAVILGRGGGSPHAGARVALGHGVVEFPLMGLLLLGFGAVLDRPSVRPALAVAAGAVLVWMGVGMLRGLRHMAGPVPGASPAAASGHGDLWAGALLTAANPYFLVWWLTVGASLLLRAADYGRPGVGAFALAHWLCDLAWFWILSAAAYGGSRRLGGRFQLAILGLCGAFLVAAGVDFLAEGVAQLRALT